MKMMMNGDLKKLADKDAGQFILDLPEVDDHQKDVKPNVTDKFGMVLPKPDPREIKITTTFERIIEISEEFMIFFFASLYLVKRYDAFTLFAERLGIDIDHHPEKINELPKKGGISINFIANFWRFGAIFMLKYARNHQGNISDANFMKIKRRLEFAE